MLHYQYKMGNIEDVKSDTVKFSDIFLVEDLSNRGNVDDNWNVFKMTLKQSMAYSSEEDYILLDGTFLE